jgi:hypothetical protein
MPERKMRSGRDLEVAQELYRRSGFETQLLDRKLGEN